MKSAVGTRQPWRWDGSAPTHSGSTTGGQISFLAATNQRHGRAATRRFRHTDFNLGHWDRVEAG
jgi:hypothetical protein